MGNWPEARRRGVFLDRDGVLTGAIVRDGKPFSPRRREDLVALGGVREACATLRVAGLLLVVVTNQPDIARGHLAPDELSAMHHDLLDRIPLDDILYCPHDDSDGCSCRKPQPGLLVQAARRWGLDLLNSVVVGDRWRDIEAGRRAGCRTVFVNAGYLEPQAEGQDFTVTSFPEAVPWILNTFGYGEANDD